MGSKDDIATLNFKLCKITTNSSLTGNDHWRDALVDRMWRPYMEEDLSSLDWFIAMVPYANMEHFRIHNLAGQPCGVISYGHRDGREQKHVEAFLGFHIDFGSQRQHFGDQHLAFCAMTEALAHLIKLLFKREPDLQKITGAVVSSEAGQAAGQLFKAARFESKGPRNRDYYRLADLKLAGKTGFVYPCTALDDVLGSSLYSISRSSLEGSGLLGDDDAKFWKEDEWLPLPRLLASPFHPLVGSRLGPAISIGGVSNIPGVQEIKFFSYPSTNEFPLSLVYAKGQSRDPGIHSTVALRGLCREPEETRPILNTYAIATPDGPRRSAGNIIFALVDPHTAVIGFHCYDDSTNAHSDSFHPYDLLTFAMQSFTRWLFETHPDIKRIFGSVPRLETQHPEMWKEMRDTRCVFWDSGYQSYICLEAGLAVRDVAVFRIEREPMIPLTLGVLRRGYTDSPFSTEDDGTAWDDPFLGVPGGAECYDDDDDDSWSDGDGFEVWDLPLGEGLASPRPPSSCGGSVDLE